MNGPVKRTLWFTIFVNEEVGGGFIAEAICMLEGIKPERTETRKLQRSPRGALRELNNRIKTVWGR